MRRLIFLLALMLLVSACKKTSQDPAPAVHPAQPASEIGVPNDKPAPPPLADAHRDLPKAPPNSVPIEFLSSWEHDGEMLQVGHCDSSDWDNIYGTMRQQREIIGDLDRPITKIRIQCFSERAYVPDIEKSGRKLPKESVPFLAVQYDNLLVPGDWRFCFGGTREDAGRQGDLKHCIFESELAKSGKKPTEQILAVDE